MFLFWWSLSADLLWGLASWWGPGAACELFLPVEACSSQQGALLSLRCLSGIRGQVRWCASARVAFPSTHGIFLLLLLLVETR